MPYKSRIREVDDAYLPDEFLLTIQELARSLREQGVGVPEYYLPANVRCRKERPGRCALAYDGVF